jgi:hypothetical protein
MKINKSGFWENDSLKGHYNDRNLLNEIRSIIIANKIKTLVDFGCGPAFYVNNIKDIVEFEAYDGNPNTPLLTNGLAKVMDLSKEVNLNKKFDCVLSLEVGEHIPKEYEEIFINNLVRHTDNMIILSWAIVGQGGDGHVNCQNNDYIINQMQKRGFIYNKELSDCVRSKNVVSWFKNTFMIFEKK